MFRRFYNLSENFLRSLIIIDSGPSARIIIDQYLIKYLFRNRILCWKLEPASVPQILKAERFYPFYHNIQW